MATYVIGDVQGSFVSLQRLLERIHFNASQDRLWFVGDLVNRGKGSLEVLRFVSALGAAQVTVLGNHDLHLLCVAYAGAPLRHEDTLTEVLQADDRESLLAWLSARPLVHYDKHFDAILVHAGLAPMWALDDALRLSEEVSSELKHPEKRMLLLAKLYGNEPALWRDDLQGVDRLRCIVNYCTRMRYCYTDGRLDFSHKGSPLQMASHGLVPWFRLQGASLVNHRRLLFGHWAALNGETGVSAIHALDTGCVWGNRLTAYCLETNERVSVAAAG